MKKSIIIVTTLLSTSISANAQILTSEVKVEQTNNITSTTGPLGIGISNPGNYRLAIHGTTNAYSSIKITNDGNSAQGLQLGNTGYNLNDAEIWNFENGYFRIGTGNAERLRITSNGNVGIGISNPTNYKVAIHGTNSAYSSIKITNDGNSAQGLQLGNTGYNLNDVEIWNFENGYFRIGTGNAERLRITSNGNVGIGISNPTNYKVAIHGTNSAYSSIKITNDGNSAQGLQLGNTGYNLNDVEVWNFENGYFRIGTGNAERLRVAANGNIGIGTTNTSNHKLEVNGSIKGTTLHTSTQSWSDFVFEKDYDLRTLEEVEQHINEKGHLPEIPSEAEITKNGINLGEMDAKLLQKIEELTLYMIDMNKRVNQLEQENIELKESNQELKAEISTLKSN